MKCFPVQGKVYGNPWYRLDGGAEVVRPRVPVVLVTGISQSVAKALKNVSNVFSKYYFSKCYFKSQFQNLFLSLQCF